jgi:hypothetical protein
MTAALLIILAVVILDNKFPATYPLFPALALLLAIGVGQ